MKRSAIFVFLSIALILLTANPILFGESTQAPKAGNRFEGRILSVYLKGPAVGMGYQLKNVKIEDVEGTKMMVGIIVGEDNDDGLEGFEMYIPVENVLNFYSLTPKQFEEANALHQNR